VDFGVNTRNALESHSLNEAHSIVFTGSISYSYRSRCLNTSMRQGAMRRRQSRDNVGVARAEKRLVSGLLAFLGQSQNKRTGVVLASEFDCFQGVADVVAGVQNGYRLFPRSAKINSRLVTLSTARVLSMLAGRKTSTVVRLSRGTGLSASTVRKQVRVLSQLGMVRLREGGRISVGRDIRPPFREITAFEVKVKDWRSGIYQARNYRSFAHKVSVVLPLNRAKLLGARLHDFRRMKVGLLGINPSGKAEWFLKPRRRRPISGPRNYLAAIKLLRKSGTPRVKHESRLGKF